MVIRIVVGVDESEPAQAALRWAVREALRRDSSLLVVTSYPEADPGAAGPAGPEGAVGSAGTPDGPAGRAGTVDWIDRSRRQREQIASARRAVAPGVPLRVARQLGTELPLVTLARAAGTADLLVVGTHQPDQARSSLSGQLSQVLHARRLAHSCPMVVVPGPGTFAGAPGSAPGREGARAGADPHHAATR